jgi:nitroreductase
MKVQAAVQKRRSYRGLDPVEITDAVVKQLAQSASLAPSCYNNQPWKFIFIRSKEKLEKMHAVLSKGNEWVHDASCIIAVMSKKDLDCVIKEREYYLFDTGIAVGQMLLTATELGLVAHAIAGYAPDKAKKLLSIPDEWNLIALIAVGKKSRKRNTIGDAERPERLALKYVYSYEEFDKKLSKKVKH